MDKRDTILVTGAAGFVGKNLIDYLEAKGFTDVCGVIRDDCDLTDRDAVRSWFTSLRPSYVFHLAGYVNGIAGNMFHQRRAYVDNVRINTNVIEACVEAKVKKVVAMGTVAMYPPSDKFLTEDDLYVGRPHESERGYAAAKRGMLAHLEGCDIPWALPVSTNLYGPHDRFNLETGHAVPSLVRKAFEAKATGAALRVWGNGDQRRDFMYINDVVRALHVIMDSVRGPVNLATGVSHSIRQLAFGLAEIAGVPVEFVDGPVGETQRRYDTSVLRDAGFTAKYKLQQGLAETYEWYAKNDEIARK